MCSRSGPVDEAIFHSPHRSDKRQKIIKTLLASAFVMSSLLCDTCYHFLGWLFPSLHSFYSYCGNIHEAECSHPTVWFDLGSTLALDMVEKQVTGS